MTISYPRLLSAALFTLLLLPAGAALAQQQPVRYKLAESIAADGTWRYTVTDRRAPEAPAPAAGTVDLQLMSLERVADDPYAWLRAGLNAQLEQEHEDKPLVEKYFAAKEMEFKLFEIQLSREYPSDSKYMNAGAMSGGLLGVLVGAIMDGMSNRANARQLVTVRVILDVDGKPVEISSRRSYDEESLQRMLMLSADAALESMAIQLRYAAREREKAAIQAATPAAEAAPAAPEASATAVAAPADGTVAAPGK